MATDAIDNTVTADSAQTTPVSRSASVMVESGASIDADEDGERQLRWTRRATSSITRSMSRIQATTTLTSLEVNDSQVNIVTPILGDPSRRPSAHRSSYRCSTANTTSAIRTRTARGPGETFQYKIAGDDNDNGVEDPGETFIYTNVGDTNQNGNEDPGETFQYYNAGDTNHNGVEDPGETFQFVVSHAATPVDADEDGFNDGDVNEDDNWTSAKPGTYTVSYTVTQDDIDNGGVVHPGLPTTTPRRPSLRKRRAEGTETVVDRPGSARHDDEDSGRGGWYG